MFIPRTRNEEGNVFELDDFNFARVTEFIYPGYLITETDSMSEKIKTRFFGVPKS